MLLFTHHIKHKIEDMQKLQRLQDYMGELNLVSESLHSLEKDEEKLEKEIHLLKEVLRVTVVDASDELAVDKPLQRNQNKPLL